MLPKGSPTVSTRPLGCTAGASELRGGHLGAHRTLLPDGSSREQGNTDHTSAGEYGSQNTGLLGQDALRVQDRVSLSIPLLPDSFSHEVTCRKLNALTHKTNACPDPLVK